MNGQIYMYTKGSLVETPAPTNWNLIDRSMTAPPPVLSPSSILPPRSSHRALIPANKTLARVSKI
jgi:hypothetical protein